MTSTRSSWAIVLVLTATVGFAFKGILARFAYAAGVDVTGLLALRAAMATPLVWLIAWALRRHFEAPCGADRFRAFACGVLFLGSAALDFVAIQQLGAGPSRVILFAYPLLVILLEAARLSRAPSRASLFAFAVAWAGLLVVSGDSWRHGASVSGVLCALGAASVHAVYLTFTQGLARRMGSVPFTAWSNTGTAAAIFTFVGLGVGASTLRFTPAGVGWLSLLALFCTALPILFMVEGVRLMGAGKSSLLSLVGPVVTLVGAYVLLDEPLTAQKLLGATLVIAAVGWHASAQSRRAPAAVAPRAPVVRAPRSA